MAPILLDFRVGPPDSVLAAASPCNAELPGSPRALGLVKALKFGSLGFRV